MKIALLNEVSTAGKNTEIFNTIKSMGYDVINAGMKSEVEVPKLTYIHTGLIAAILLNLKRADFVIGGCGTGQGFLNACMQYSGVFCGYITNPIDAWLFAQINGGNCISLAFNLGYGWAGDINVKFILEKFFSVKSGSGYPEHRKESQRESRENLFKISDITHRLFSEIIESLPDDIIMPVLNFPGMLDLIEINSIKDAELRRVFKKRLSK